MKHPDSLSLGRLLWTYARPLWKTILLLLLLSMLANLLVVVQPMLLAAILSLILGRGGVAASQGEAFFDLNSLGARVMEWLNPLSGDLAHSVFVLGALFLVQAVVVGGLNYSASLAALRVRVRATQMIQLDLMRHLLPLGLRFFHREKTGELISRLTQDATNTARGIGPLVRSFIHHGVQIAVFGAYLFSTNVGLSVGALGFIALQFGLNQVLKKPVRTRTRRVLDVMAGFSTTFQETLTSIRVVKSFGAESYELKKLGHEIDAVAGATFSDRRVKNLEEPARSVLDSLAVVGILLIAVMQLRAGALTTQGLLLYLYVGRLMIAPVNYMATNFLWIQALLASYERLKELLSEQPEVVDGPVVKSNFENKIEVRGVSFSYGHGVVLDKVSLEINKGEVVALVGPSGAGKSTLADLLLRLYDPESGSILMDGVDLWDVKQTEYRQIFGVVSQECLLFHDTVENNIRYGREGVTEEDVKNAARVANAHDFIMGLPHGYDTLVGDRGARLSGGQRQRVAIARAIAGNPQILILDEATSALDSESERLVQDAIDRVIKDNTAIVIAHRLSTVLQADKIVVLINGRIEAIGRHDDLLRTSPMYEKLYKAQFTSTKVQDTVTA